MTTFRGSISPTSGSATSSKSVDTFSGDNSTVVFVLTSSPNHDDDVLISVSGVIQHQNGWSRSTTTITFTEAPPTGTNNIEIYYR